MAEKPSKKLRVPGEIQKHLKTVTALLQNESGRGAILVGTAYLEELLAEVIRLLNVFDRAPGKMSKRQLR